MLIGPCVMTLCITFDLFLLLQCADLSLYLGVRLLYFAILPLHSSVLQFRHWEKQLCCCDLSFSWRAFQYSVLSRYRAVRHDTQKRVSDKINYFPPKSRHVSNQDRATERKYINIITILAGNNLSCPKLVSECYAELHDT